MKPNIITRWIRYVFRIDEQLEHLDEQLARLELIDSRLEKLEKCVRPGIKHKPYQAHIATGHWND